MNNNYWSKQAINERLFTTDYNSLIKVLKQTTIDPTKPIPVELVKELCRLRKEINQLKQPMFTENDTPVMKYWEEYKYTGLSNVDYANSNFYKQGFGDNFIELIGNDVD